MNRRELKAHLQRMKKRTVTGGSHFHGFETGRGVETNGFNIGINEKLKFMLLPALDALPVDARVLEIGIGKGVAFAQLRQRYPHLKFYGTNYYPEGRNPSTEPHIAHAGGSNVPHHDNTFDLVYSVEMFPYLADKLRHLEEVHRVLKKGGTALIYHAGYNNGSYFKNGKLVDVRLQDKPEIKIHGTEKGVIEITKQKPRLRFGMKLNLQQTHGENYLMSIYRPKPLKRCALRHQQKNE